MMQNVPDRIYAQYRDKPKAVAWYAITRTLAAKICDAAQKVRKSYDIDSAVGEQLNTIGRIVVVGRDFKINTELFPGFFDLTDGSECGDDDGAQFSALTIEDDSQLSDDLYRLVIKAKIVKNNSDATIEGILAGMNFLLPNAEVLRVVDGEDMTFSIEFYGQISNIERYALLNAGLIPKPQGVRFNGFLEGFGYVEAGDDELQFGDESAECVGFIGV
jgi:hypothetical protein